MHSSRRPLITVAAVAAFLLGAGFFNTVVGVFGLTVAVASLIVFVGLALAAARVRQPEEHAP